MPKREADAPSSSDKRAKTDSADDAEDPLIVYQPAIVPQEFARKVNTLVDVLVPPEFLTIEHKQIRLRHVWGTDVYTDDSDLVAVLVGGLSGQIIGHRIRLIQRRELQVAQHLNRATADVLGNIRDGTFGCLVSITDVCPGARCLGLLRCQARTFGFKIHASLAVEEGRHRQLDDPIEAFRRHPADFLCVILILENPFSQCIHLVHLGHLGRLGRPWDLSHLIPASPARQHAGEVSIKVILQGTVPLQATSVVSSERTGSANPSPGPR